MTEHAVDKLRRDLTFGHAGLYDVQDLVQRRLADALGVDHGGDLLLGLDHPEVPKQLARALELHAELLLPAEEGRVAEALVLRRDLFGAHLREGLFELGSQRACPVEHAHLSALGLLFGRLDVAGVGDKEGLLPADEHRAVGKGEARGIALVFLVGDKQRVQTALDEFFPDSCDLIHVSCPSS